LVEVGGYFNQSLIFPLARRQQGRAGPRSWRKLNGENDECGMRARNIVIDLRWSAPPYQAGMMAHRNAWPGDSAAQACSQKSPAGILTLSVSDRPMAIRSHPPRTVTMRYDRPPELFAGAA